MSENDYRPLPHFALARTLRGIARTCMDTSDGLLATLDEISRRSGVRVSIDVEPTALLTDRAARVQQALSVPALALLGAIHGEFELVFALDATARSRLPPDTLQRCIRLGVVREGTGVEVLGRVVDTMAIRNLGAQQPLDARKYLASLVDLCR
jgi:thiamine-monophosphate kinase